MFKFNRLKDQTVVERNKRQSLEAKLASQVANMDYVAMIADVDIPIEDIAETGGGDRDVPEV